MPTKNERDVEERERNFIRTRASENGKDQPCEFSCVRKMKHVIPYCK